MENIPLSIQKIIGKWKLVDWKNQTILHHPDDYLLDAMKSWDGYSEEKLNEFYQQIGQTQDWKKLNITNKIYSNFLNVAIGNNNLSQNKISDIEIEFTSKELRNKSIFDFIVFLKKDVLNNFYWENCDDNDYCDLDILTNEVYNYVKLKIIELNENKLVVLEIIDNETKAYFQKLTFEKVDLNKKIQSKNSFLQNLTNLFKTENYT
jgi:hypothetical protein